MAGSMDYTVSRLAISDGLKFVFAASLCDDIHTTPKETKPLSIERYKM